MEAQMAKIKVDLADQCKLGFRELFILKVFQSNFAVCKPKRLNYNAEETFVYRHFIMNLWFVTENLKGLEALQLNIIFVVFWTFVRHLKKNNNKTTSDCRPFSVLKTLTGSRAEKSFKCHKTLFRLLSPAQTKH